MSLLHVVIPAFGKSPFLRTAISSAISSVSSETPITVLDDASDTNEIREIATSFGSRVSYLRNESNLGLASNFFHAFQVSVGEFTVVMGSDDKMLQGYEAMVTSLVKEYPGASMIMPNVSVIDANGNPVYPLVDRIKRLIRGRLIVSRLVEPKELIDKLFVGNFLYFPAIAWNTAALLEAKWDKDYLHAVDLDLLFNLSIAKHKLLLSKDATFQYRRHSQSISSMLAHEDTRLSEELKVHKSALQNLQSPNNWKTVLLANLALTIRIHAIIIGIKQIPQNPNKGLRHIFSAMRSLQRSSTK